jgi:L-asparaginase
MKPTRALALLACGGTFDKDYDPISGELVFSDSHVPEVLAQANPQLALRLEVVMLKDSLQMDDQDRRKLLDACCAARESHIVITHGTDTMTDSAKLLRAYDAQLTNKTIVFTGAMRPFRLSNSDAGFNLGCAIIAAQLAPPGIYIAMNGRLLSAEDAEKNRKLGIFEPRQGVR